MKRKRTERFAVRLTSIEKHMLEQLSVYSGLDNSDVIRQLIRKERALYERKRR